MTLDGETIQVKIVVLKENLKLLSSFFHLNSFRISILHYTIFDKANPKGSYQPPDQKWPYESSDRAFNPHGARPVVLSSIHTGCTCAYFT